MSSLSPMSMRSQARLAARRAAGAAALAGVLLAVPVTAWAGPACDVPMAEWQPREMLQQKLADEGWDVRRIKIDDGCYEVYAIDPQGRRAEVYFDPRSLTPVGQPGAAEDDSDHGAGDHGAGDHDRQ